MGKYDSLLADAPKAGKYAALMEPSAPAPTESPAPDQPGTLGRIGRASLGVLGAIGNGIARVSTAPIAAGLSAAQDVATSSEGLDKSTLSQIPEGLAAFGQGFASRFGRDPSQSPTYKQVLTRAGVSDAPMAESKAAPNTSGTSRYDMPLPSFGGASPAGLLGGIAEAATPIPGLSELGGLAKMTAKPAGKVLNAVAEGGAKAVDMATGTEAASKTLGATKAVAEGLGNTFGAVKESTKKLFNPKQVDDFGESVKTAMANGIDPKLLPEAVEFGPSSIMTRTARVQNEGFVGEQGLNKFHEGLGQVRDAVQADIQKIGGGAPISKVEAGNVLRDGFNAGVDRAFQDVATSHKSILAQAPDLRLAPSQIEKIAPKLEELQKWAEAKAANGITNTAKGQGQQILNALDAFRKKGESYAGSYEALQEIGDVAFKSKNTLGDIPPDISRFRKLYGDISDAMIGTVGEHFGADMAKSLKESNAEMHKIYGDKSLLGKIGQENMAPEQMYQSIIEHGDTKRIQALKDYLQPEELAAVKGAFLNSLIKADAEGNFPFKSLNNALRQKNTVASVLFEPGELDNLHSLIKLGDKFGNAVMSTSGTGASNAIRESVKEIGNSVADNAISGGLKQKARAIGFDVSDPGRLAAQGNPRPPTMGLGSQQSLSPSIGKLAGLDWRKRLARSYSSQNQEQP